jgi:hypothetical protein
MSYSDTPMIDTISKTDYSQLEKLNNTYEEMKLLLIIFGSIISIMLFFLLNLALIYYCKSQEQKRKSDSIELNPVENDNDQSTLI